MTEKRIVDVDTSEALAEISQGVELEYRIVEVKQHRRKKQDDGTLKWVDDIYYQVEKWYHLVSLAVNGKLLYFKMNMVQFLNLKTFLIYRIGYYIELVKDMK